MLLALGASVGWPRQASAQEDPAAPTGQAACEVAFTAVAAVSFGSYSVPPEAPLGPNDVIVALTPILRACADRYPPAPTRRCVTSDLYPDTGIPVTPPDPVGVATEQIERTASAAGDPLGLALGGPLRSLFASALACEDADRAPDSDPDAAPIARLGTSALPATPAPAPTTTRDADAGVVPAIDVGEAPSEKGPPKPTSSSARVAGPVTSFVSAVPEPLRGPAAVGSVAALVGLASVLQRQLSPRRRRSLAEVAIRGGG